MASPLADLDELILKCRNEKAKQYIQEAVICYKANAFRSAIISTWIAVTFDIIDKIYELSLAGDKEAEMLYEEFETLKKSGDISAALNFEKKLLITSRDKLEFISHVEYVDLHRIQQDRNRCAHPSLTTDGDIFIPSAELARVHISSAVNYLLQYPPAQGKYALEKLLAEIDSDYFPSNEDGAFIAFQKGPLKKPRESLVRNLTIVLIKKLLKDNVEYKVFDRIIAALSAIRKMFNVAYSNLLSEKLSEVSRTIEDGGINKLFMFIWKLQCHWEYLDIDVQQRLQNYVRNIPSTEFVWVESALNIPPLSEAAKYRISLATSWELSNAFFFITPPEVRDRIINGYLNSHSFADANEWAKIVNSNAADFSKEQVIKLLLNMSKNSQIRESREIDNVIRRLRTTKIGYEEFETLLNENGLKKYSNKNISTSA